MGAPLFKLFGRFLKPFALLVVCACAFTFLQVIAELQLPSIMADIVDTGIYNKDLSYVIAQGLTMLAWAIGSVVCVVIAALCASRASMGFGRDVRSALFTQVQSYSLAEFESFGASTLITRNTNDVQQVERFLQMLITMAIMTPCMFIGAVIMAFMTNAEMAALIFIAIPVIIAIVLLFLRVGMPILRSLQSRIDAVNRVMREELQGVRTIRAYNKEAFERKRFGTVNRDLCDTYIKVGRLMGALIPVMMLVVNFTIVALYYFGATQIDAGRFSAGEIMALVQYVTLILMSLMMVSMVFAMLPRAMAASERMNAVLSTSSSITGGSATLEPLSGAASTTPEPARAVGVTPAQETASSSSVEAAKGAARANGVQSAASQQAATSASAVPAMPSPPVVEMRQVSFCYPDSKKNALSDLTFTLEPNTTTALIGPTGSGKSSLINLIMRMYDPTQGTIMFRGVNIQELSLEALREHISYTPQKTFLFTGSVAHNLRFGNEQATDDQLWEVLDIARATEFITPEAGGLNFEISQGGENLSGGQRQRLAIARCLLRPADLYIFDDSFSALDFKTDALVRAGIKNYLNNQSVLTVTQRVNVALGADQVILLSDEGLIEACGTHEELFATCEAYRELALSQLSEEELTAALPKRGGE